MSNRDKLLVFAIFILLCIGTCCDINGHLRRRYQNSIALCTKELIRHQKHHSSVGIFRYFCIYAYLESNPLDVLQARNAITSAIWYSNRPNSADFQGVLLFDWVADDPREAIGFVIKDIQGEKQSLLFAKGMKEIQDKNAEKYVIYTYSSCFDKENPAPVTQGQISEGCKIALLLENGQESEYISIQHKTEDGFVVKAEEIPNAKIELPGEDNTEMVLYKVGPDLSLIPIDK